MSITPEAKTAPAKFADEWASGEPVVASVELFSSNDVNGNTMHVYIGLGVQGDPVAVSVGCNKPKWATWPTFVNVLRGEAKRHAERIERERGEWVIVASDGGPYRGYWTRARAVAGLRKDYSWADGATIAGPRRGSATRR